MNLNMLAKHYGTLTPEERFALVLAAGARGDDAEQRRLTSAGGRLTLSVRDHASYALALQRIEEFLFVELLAAAADYEETFNLALAAENDAPPDTGTGKEGDGRTVAERLLSFALLQGFLLKVKFEGWKLFCQRRDLPPLVHWQTLPGFDRLQRSLKLAEKAAFVPEGYLHWLNSIRPTGAPEATEVDATPERIANELETLFRERVRWWGGRGE